MYALTGGRRSSIRSTPAVGKSEGSLTELGIHFDSSFGVLQRFWKCRQLGIPICSVIIPPGIVRIPLDAFGVSLNGTSEITLLEQSVSFFPSLSRFLRIDVSKLLSVGLVTFSLTEFIEDVRGSVLCERFVEILDGGSEVPGLGVSGPDTPVSLCDELVIRPDLRW